MYSSAGMRAQGCQLVCCVQACMSICMCLCTTFKHSTSIQRQCDLCEGCLNKNTHARVLAVLCQRVCSQSCGKLLLHLTKVSTPGSATPVIDWNNTGDESCNVCGRMPPNLNTSTPVPCQVRLTLCRLAARGSVSECRSTGMRELPAA